VLIIAAIVTAGSAPAAQQASSATVKAAFLYNFAKFVEWPPDPAGAEPQQFVIGVLGNDDVAQSLTDIVKGKSLHGRPVSAKRLGFKDDLTKLHVLYIGSSESGRIPELMKRLGKTASVLTIADADRFRLSGGIIQFRTEADRVRFDIDMANAEAAGLVINSKLLALAGTVHPSKTH
jgi:hypothetical protein